MRTGVRTLFFGLLAGLALAAPSADADTRVALVIGNSAYQHAPALPNPRNDAEALAASLKRLDFDVLLGVDLDKLAMERILQRFSEKIENADVALVFYAGHGLQVARRNYLVPVDAKLDKRSDLLFRAISLDVVLNLMSGGQRTNILMLDACRDNPLARSLARSMGTTRSAGVTRGLAPVQQGIGTLIVYATSPGAVALDGDGRHSPFTTALLKYIETPGLEIGQVLKRVQRSVRVATKGKQIPWNVSSLEGDVYLVPRRGRRETEPRKLGPGPVDKETVFWRSIRDGRSVAAYRAYLKRWPNGVFADLARQRIAALRKHVPDDTPEKMEKKKQRRDLTTDPTAKACVKGEPRARIRACNRVLAEFQLSKVNRAITYYNRGVAHRKLKQYRKAIADYDQAIRIRPRWAYPYHNRGWSHFLLEEYRKAIADFDQALRLNPRKANTRAARARAYHELGQNRRALADLGRAIVLDPKEPRNFYWRAVVYNQLGDNDKALTDLDAAIRLDPKNADAYYLRGKVHSALKHYLLAVSDFDEVVRRKPRWAPAYVTRGLTHYEFEKYAMAIGDFDQAAKLAPGDAHIYFVRGRTYLRLKGYKAAIADFDRAIRLNPRDPHALADRGLAHQKTGDRAAAIRDYRAALRLDPKEPVAKAGLKKLVRATPPDTPKGADAPSYRQSAKMCASEAPAAAIAGCTRVLTRFKTSRAGRAIAYLNRGVAYGRLKQYRNANADFTQAIALDPRSADAYNNRCVTRRHLKAYQHAIADCDQAIRLKPGAPNAYNNRGAVYLYYLRQYRRAIADFDRAIRLDPRRVNAYGNRAIANERLGNRAAAIRDFRAVLRLRPTDRYAAAALRRLKAATRDPSKPSLIAPPESTPDAKPTSPKDAGGWNTCVGHIPPAAIAACTKVLADSSTPRLTRAAAHLHRGLAYQRSGNRTAAIRDLRAALRIKPGDAMAAYYLKQLGVTP